MRYPDVKIRYTRLLDPQCAKAAGDSPPETEMDEVEARLGEFQALWAKDGPALLSATQALTEIPWRFHETIVALHVCKGIGSMSLPLIINMRPHLRSGRYNDRPHHFTDLVFHELLHRYIVDALTPKGNELQVALAESPLLAKYKSEKPSVRYHLHLYALQEIVYRKLGREEVWADVKPQSDSDGGRAAAIVDHETPEAFIADLRSMRDQ